MGARSSRAPRSDLEHREVRERDPVQGGAAWLAAERLIERRYSAGTVSRVRAYPSQGIKPKETHKMIKSGSVLGIGVALVLAVSTSAFAQGGGGGGAGGAGGAGAGSPSGAGTSGGGKRAR